MVLERILQSNIISLNLTFSSLTWKSPSWVFSKNLIKVQFNKPENKRNLYLGKILPNHQYTGFSYVKS